jgi:hypothetical protein
MGLTNPFTVDVTKLYVSNAGTVNANFNVRVLECLHPPVEWWRTKL